MKLLIVEKSSKTTRKLLEGFFSQEQCFEIQTVNFSDVSMFSLRAFDKFTVVLIDWSFIDEEVFAIIEKIRSKSIVPIILLSCDFTPSKIVKMLDKGADDALKAPFSLDELNARLLNLSKRPRSLIFKDTKIRFKKLEIDIKNHQVKAHGKIIPLTKTEYMILTYLALNRERPSTSTELLTRLFEKKYSKCRHLLNMHIFNLKKKLKNDFPITTIPSIGFIIK